ncbi:MAG: zf-HC2 domain-containing protein [candidate division NC10 bacterium]|nr:zf-HC2 domain-containing protein [candidate division NC10 bacterium]
MDCQAVRELYLEGLIGGRAASPEVERHLAACPACREETQTLAATWTVLATLPLLEPSRDVARRLYRRVRWEGVREALASIESWQRAALAGVAGFVVSVVLSLLVPYETMVAFCQAIAPPSVPAPAAYLLAGVLYGLLPMVIGTALEARSTHVIGLMGTLEAVIVFLLVLVPYVLLRCGEFPASLLAGFVGGIALGAMLGSAAGTGLRRRRAWAS